MSQNSPTRTLVAVSLFAMTLASAGAASANGRYPQAMQFSEDPSDPARLWVRTTYGLITSPDRGAHWNWICEEAMGFSSLRAFDPTIGLLQNGTVIVGTESGGLMRTKNQGCDWGNAIAALEDKFVLDVSVNAQDKSRALALVSFLPSSSTGPTYTNEIWETTNNGDSFSQILDNIPGNLFSVTLDSAPSNPDRVYLSGGLYESGTFSVLPTPVLLRSDDRGKTWKSQTIPAPKGSAPYIAAVHPTNPDIVYVRTQERNDSTLVVTSTLYYTTNGGASFNPIFSGAAPMLGFALSPDGTRVAVGLGDPGDQSATIDPSKLGMWRSPAPAFDFQKANDHSITCLSWTGNGLYACSQSMINDKTSFDLALFKDGCASLQILQDRRHLTGPLACPSGSTMQTTCTSALWQTACYNIPCEDGGVSTGGPAHECSDGGGSGGAGGVAGTGGTGGASSGGSAGSGAGGASSGGSGAIADAGPDASQSGGSAGTTAKSNEDDSSNCSCRVTGGTRTSALGALAVLGLLAALGRRRRE